MDNHLIAQLFAQINKAIDNKLNTLTQVKSATVHSVNQNGTINIFIPPNKTVYHNIQNQSIYRNIQPGDNVKVIIENGNLSNMWIIGGFNLESNNFESNNPESNNLESNLSKIQNKLQMLESYDTNVIDEQYNECVKQLKTLQDKQQQITSSMINFDMIYPIGSIYMSTSSISPTNLFGGQWQKIEDRFLLSAGSTYAAGGTGGEATHLLTAAESGCPGHTHVANYSGADFYIRHGNTANTDTVKQGTNTTVEEGIGEQWSNGYNTTSYSHNIDKVSIGGTVSVENNKAQDAISGHNNMPPYLVVYMWKRIG